jgi:Family of unknown function (DUF6156)
MDNDDMRYFLTYSGIKLPLKLVSPLPPDSVANRNTYFGAKFDGHERIVLCRKIVYGEIEFEHRYAYHDNGALRRAEIEAEDETRVVEFDEQGAMA